MAADSETGSDAGFTQDAAAVVQPVTALPDGPDAYAFDFTRGALNVDYASYLSKHDVVFNQPNADPVRGLTVGNGRVGAMVWNQDGLSMQLANVDSSEQTAFAAGLVRVQTTPALTLGGDQFQQRLALYDGSLITRYGDQRTITVMGVPKAEVIGVHVSDARSAVAGATVELSLWDVSQLQNSGAARNFDSWKSVSTFADQEAAGLSRGQQDPDQFGYTLAATVEGAAFTTQQGDARTVRLNIAPSASYTIWIAVGTRINAPGHDSVAAARSALASAKDAGYAATSAEYQAFWHAFWQRSFVQYGNAEGDADYLENVYYLATYMIAAGSYGEYPFHFINGVFRATHDDTKWSNGYWYWNQRDVYNAFLANNHADVMDVFNRLYSRNADALHALTTSRYGSDGLWVPETMGWNGNADGTVGSDYTKNIFSTATEAAENMYAQYAFLGDEAYLKDTAYPFMRDAAKLYQHQLSSDGDGQRFMASSNAHETYWNVKNAITDLAAVRTLFPHAIAASERLGVDAELRAQWQDVLDHLVAYPTDAEAYLAHEPPLAQTRNGENVACELIWPYGATGIDAPDYARALATWKQRPFPYGNVWANDAVQAARLGLGDEAKLGMKTMLEKYQSHPNGMTNNTNGVFEYLGVHLSALDESLLQSYDDRIRVFPAIPSDPSFVGRFSLLARGGFMISSEREQGEVKYVGVKSLLGNPIALVNPWGDEPVQVRAIANDLVIFSGSAAVLELATERDAVYVVERVARPLTDYAYARIDAEANQDAKRMSAACSLGIAR